METIYIYTLSCPITKEIRYVGKTKSIKLRLQSHIDYARNTKRKRRHVSDWILGLLEQNLKPIITIIEKTDVVNWVDRERYWISHFKNLQFNLCNLTDGGESNTGYVYSDELKEVRRKARIGYKIPDTTKEKIRKSLSKKIKCVEDGLIFPSIKDAVIHSGIPKTTFHRKLYKGELINNKTYHLI
jgi:hypothetical protein